MLVCIMTVILKLRCEMLLIGLLSVKITFFCHSNNVLPWMIPEYPLAFGYLILFMSIVSLELSSLKSCERFTTSISVVKQVSEALCSILLHLSYMVWSLGVASETRKLKLHDVFFQIHFQIAFQICSRL